MNITKTIRHLSLIAIVLLWSGCQKESSDSSAPASDFSEVDSSIETETSTHMADGDSSASIPAQPAGPAPSTAPPSGAPAAAGAPGMAGMPSDVSALYQKAVQAQQEYQELSERLQTIQAKAMESEALQQQLEDLKTSVMALLAEQSPESAKSVEKMEDLAQEINASEEVQTKTPDQFSEELQGKISEYRELQESVAPAQEAVLQDPKVVSEREAYDQALETEMQKVEPETEQLLARQKALMSTLQSLKMQIMQMQQQQGGAPMIQPGPNPGEGEGDVSNSNDGTNEAGPQE